MKLLHFRYTLTCTAFIVSAGCNGSLGIPTPGAAMLPATTVHISLMAPLARSKDLLYIADLGTNSVDVFTYPQGTQVGTLTGFGSVASLCSNAGGDVFVVDEAGPVDVYAHGGSSPIRKLSTDGAPDGCAVDPTTGDLALTNESSYLDGVIRIYAHAMGKGKVYRKKGVDTTLFCAYDNKGNLFIDGTSLGESILLELSHGGTTLGLTKLQNFTGLGGVQWDGKYVAIADKGAGLIYRIDPSSGQVEQTIHLHGAPDIDQFWIQRGTVIGPNAKSFGNVPFWNYPGGGSPTKTLTGFTYPVGATVSIAH